MYRIGVLSDSHGSISALKKAIRSMGEVDFVYFLGDYVSDMERVRKYFHMPVLCVKGNGDFTSNEKLEHIISNFGISIMLTHGHRYGVKFSLTRLSLTAQANNIDLVCFGHTHVPLIERDGRTVFVNPGACSGYKPSYCVVEVDDGIITPTIYYL